MEHFVFVDDQVVARVEARDEHIAVTVAWVGAPPGTHWPLSRMRAVAVDQVPAVRRASLLAALEKPRWPDPCPLCGHVAEPEDPIQ